MFVILQHWPFENLSSIPEDQWSEVIIAYDNMCHLDSLRIAKNPLPLPPPFDTMWMKVRKTIDSLHIKNHKSARCQELYHPDNIQKDHPLYNLMCAEQTFVWLSRYKRIMCSMTKTHHLFFLHRMIVHRNSYTQTCHATNRKPLLPKAKTNTKSTV